MGELQYIGDSKLCKECRYCCRIKTYYVHCDYIGFTGHSRIFENGKKRLPKDYCDCFEERESK